MASSPKSSDRPDAPCHLSDEINPNTKDAIENGLPRETDKRTPNDLQDVNTKASNIGTCFNFLRGNVGTGILALPVAVKNAGLLVGSIGLILVGLLCAFCMHQLLNVHRALGGHRRQLTYPNVAKAVFAESPNPKLRKCANAVGLIADICLVCVEAGLICCYIDFIARMFEEVVDGSVVIYRVFPDVTTSTNTTANSSSTVISNDLVRFHVPLIAYQAIVALVLIPYSLIKNLSSQVYFSYFSNVVTFVSLGVVLQYAVRSSLPPKDLPMAKPWDSIFLFFGTAMFSYDSIILVLPQELNMRENDKWAKWDGLLSRCMILIILMNTTVGCIGYMAFGENAKVILSNMPNEFLYELVKIANAVTVLTSINNHLKQPVDVCWPPLQSWVGRPWFDRNGESIVRVCFVLIFFGISASLPCLEPMISLCGSLTVPMLSLIFPPIIEIVYYYNNLGVENASVDQQPSSTYHEIKVDISGSSLQSLKNTTATTTKYFTWVVIRGILIISIGIAGSVVGSWMTINEFVSMLNEGLCSH